MFIKKNKSQVWVETAIYTLIGLTIISILLSIALPQIEEIKDREVIRQVTDIFIVLDEKILEAEQASGSIRILQFKLSEGTLIIDSENDSISYTLKDTRLKLSEPGEGIQEGDLFLKTEIYGSKYNILLRRDYDNLNITYQGEEKEEVFHQNIIYKIQIENMGDNLEGEDTHIDFNVL